MRNGWLFLRMVGPVVLLHNDKQHVDRKTIHLPMFCREKAAARGSGGVVVVRGPRGTLPAA